MTGKSAKQLPHERRKGEAALSDFAEYVEKQQALRYPSSKQMAAAAAVAVATGSAQGVLEHHEELDDILDSLDLSDPTPRVRLRELLLCPGGDADTLQNLVDIVKERLLEGHGETVFDIGFENSGEGMKLPRDEWDVAQRRLAEAAKTLRADTQLLLTKNVGGDVDGAPTRDGDCSGKVMIRQAPDTVEEVIETRIAVVGNVDAGKSSMLGVLVKGDLMTVGARHESTSFDTNTKLRPGGHHLLAWRLWALTPQARSWFPTRPGESCRGRRLGNAAPKSSHSRISRVTNGTCAPQFSGFCRAAQTIACSWLQPTTGLLA